VTAPAVEDNTAVRSFRSFTESRIGIGATSPEYKLDIVGTARAHEIRVNTQKTADFVFESNYELPNLDSVKTLIQENKHLPVFRALSRWKKKG